MSYLVTLDDYSMTDVSNLVHIVDVIELQPGRTTNTKERLGAPGSIVTRDLPAGVVAVGNPCRVMRQISERDREFYFKDHRIDWEDVARQNGD